MRKGIESNDKGTIYHYNAWEFINFIRDKHSIRN